MSASKICPVCSTSLAPIGAQYSVDELFRMWQNARFSPESISEHQKQSAFTQLHTCPNCQLEIFLPQVIGLPGFYESLLASDPTYYSADKWDFEEALRDAKKVNSVIEIGCGPGNFLGKVQPHVEKVSGTEYNDTALGIARNKGLEVFSIHDVISSTSKGLYDIAFSFHVLEHVADPIEFIQEMLSWVKPSGQIAISVPNMDGPIKYIDPCISNMPPHHATRWRRRTFEVLADKFNLNVTRIAFEPLFSRDQYYYTDIAFNRMYQNNTIAMRVMRSISKRSVRAFFRLLSFFGKDSTHLLRGQSIYILMSKKELSAKSI